MDVSLCAWQSSLHTTNTKCTASRQSSQSARGCNSTCIRPSRSLSVTVAFKRLKGQITCTYCTDAGWREKSISANTHTQTHTQSHTGIRVHKQQPFKHPPLVRASFEISFEWEYLITVTPLKQHQCGTFELYLDFTLGTNSYTVTKVVLDSKWRCDWAIMLAVMRKRNGSSVSVRESSKGEQSFSNSVWGSARPGRKKKNSVAVLTVSKWMRTEHHTSQSNGDKQSGFGRLVRKKKKAWAKAELESLQRRLFTEKCQRPSYPACTEQAEQSKPLSFSAPHSDSLHINTHTDTSPALLYVTALTTSVKKVLLNI